ncbi:MAG TPA: MarR family transcriptional regulator [Rhodospirillales bacterium]|jgi:DNA-binding MarR family transcriptional regulator|nr:MarR family transcriptional regulator [Rhodospirillales bacterium]HIN20886.1 MarR family transcriptional regulator [Rhodospirillales bacterium]
MTGRMSKPARAILDGTAGCACLSLRGAARAVTQMYDEILKPSGLKATQFSVLAAVATQGPASMTVISNALVMDRTTLTRNLKPLMGRGLIKSGKSQDRRQRPIEITSKGETVLARALPLWKQAHDQIVTGVGFARWQGMVRLLEETINLSH